MSEPRWRIVQADLRNADLMQLVGSGYHAVLCDPPYGLAPDGKARTWDDLDGADGRGFMGKAWDAAVPGATFWRNVRRCLRPGAHLLAFGGTRTYHRLVCGIEDAGLEVRDQLAWLYGSGFPKSHDVSKAIDAAAGAEREVVGHRHVTNAAQGKGLGHGSLVGGKVQAGLIDVTAPATPEAVRWNGYGTALKPAHEPIVLAREPLDGTVAHNALTHGCGGLAIDASRVAYASDADREALAKAVELVRAKGGVRNNSWANTSDLSGANPASEKGRWPANVLLDEAAAEMLDEQSGERPGMSGGGKHREGYGGGMFGSIDCTHTARGDTGGASRFFYVAKANRSEREAGCDAFERHIVGSLQGGGTDANDPVSKRFTKVASNVHPTVKPIELATYLARMLLPPPGPEPRRILVPFSGSGSEMIGAVLAGWDEVVGVEMSEEYIAIATARLKHWAKRTAPKKKTTKPQPRKTSMPVQMEMF